MANIASVRRAGASGPSPADPHDKESRREPFSNGLACCRTDRWRTLAGAFARLSVQSLTISSRGTDMGGGGGGSTAPAYPSVCLPAPATSVLPRTEHGDFSTLSLVSHSKQFKARYPACSFFAMLPFSYKTLFLLPSFCFVSPSSHFLSTTLTCPPIHPTATAPARLSLSIHPSLPLDGS